MIRFYQALDSFGEQTVLLLAVSDLDVIPNVGEELDINGNDFVVLRVKHYLKTAELTQEVEVVVVPPSMLVEVEYQDIPEGGYDY